MVTDHLGDDVRLIHNAQHFQVESRWRMRPIAVSCRVAAPKGLGIGPVACNEMLGMADTELAETFRCMHL